MCPRLDLKSLCSVLSRQSARHCLPAGTPDAHAGPSSAGQRVLTSACGHCQLRKQFSNTFLRFLLSFIVFVVKEPTFYSSLFFYLFFKIRLFIYVRFSVLSGTNVVCPCLGESVLITGISWVNLVGSIV